MTTEKNSSVALLSAIANALYAPKGSRMEGGAHGFARGLGAEAGGVAGSVGGAGLGALGGAAANALAKRFRLPLGKNLANAGAAIGFSAGGLSGGVGGYQGAKKLFGPASYEKASTVKEAGPLQWLARGVEGAGKFLAKPMATTAGKAWQTGMKYAPTATIGATAAAVPAANELFAAAGAGMRNLTGGNLGWDGVGGVKWDPGRAAAEVNMPQGMGGHLRTMATKPIQSMMGLLGFQAADNAPRFNQAKYDKAYDHAIANNLPVPAKSDSMMYDMGPELQQRLDHFGQGLGGWDMGKVDHQKYWENITKQKYQKYNPGGNAAPAPAPKPINMQNMPEFLPRVAAGF